MAAPNCANYPPGYFVNDDSNCQAYWYCANANSPPHPGMCPVPYNFNQARQLCDHPSNFPCYATPSPSPTPTVTNPTPSTTPYTTPCPTTTPTTPVPGLPDYNQVAVREHNYYRNIHGVPNVDSFSSDINNFAYQWANHLASTDQFYHSSGSGFGENLYKSWGGSSDQNVIVANAIKLFYDEIRYYNWNNPGFSMETGHFTQVVWKASIEIGVGVAVYPDATYGHRAVVAINYRPPGNYQGQFPQNVLPPRTRLLDSNRALSRDEDMPAKVMVL